VGSEEEEEPMRWTRKAAWGVSLGAVALAIVAVSCAERGTEQGQTAMDPLERGRYLTWVTGCQDCHTPGTLYGAPDTTRALSGSDLGWQGPWGVTYPRNLTPDSATGIGSWTEADIERALRSGQRPDGSPILPPMPWPNYSRFTAEDMRALVTYLKSLPAVSHRVPDRVPPGGRPATPVLSFPNPPPWDAQNLPRPPGAPTDTTAGG
jgi:mono/diheme cytochrome c family protein